MKKKVAIYGTGVDGRRLHRILRKKKNIKIICFLETDIGKNNSKFFKLPVIHPKNTNYKFDEIYLGGRYMDEQEEYLHKFKIDKKIIRTDRWIYKYSKKDIETRDKILVKILSKIINFFEKNKISYYIEGSSLLAIARKQKLAEFTDVDIAVINCNLDNIYKKIKSYLKEFKVEKKMNKSKNYLFEKNKIFKIDVKSKCNTYKREPVTIEFFLEKKIKKFYFRPIGNGIFSRVPAIFRKKKTNIKYKNLKLSIPSNYRDCLTYFYGKNWKIKNQNWKNSLNKKRFVKLSEVNPYALKV